MLLLRCVLCAPATALALRLAELDARLVLSGRDQAALDSVKRECEARRVAAQPQRTAGAAAVVEAFDLAWVGGVNGAAELRQVVERVERAVGGRLDLLVNNGGLSVRGAVAETALHVDHELMNVNYFGAVALTKACLPLLLRGASSSPPSPSTLSSSSSSTSSSSSSSTSSSSSSSSSAVFPAVLFVNSVQGLLSLGHRSAYAASKHALTAFCASLRYELSGRLLVTAVFPGYVRTNLSVNALQADGRRHGRMDANTDSGMRPEDVAERCLTALAARQSHVVMADLKARAALHLLYWAPALLTRVLTKQAAKAEEAHAQQPREHSSSKER